MTTDLEQAIEAHKAAKADREHLTETLATFRAELATLTETDAAEKRVAARRLLTTGESELSPAASERIARMAAIKAALAESDGLLRNAALAEMDAWRAVQAEQSGERFARFNAAAERFAPAKAKFAAVLATWADYRGMPAAHIEAVFSDLLFSRRDVLT